MFIAEALLGAYRHGSIRLLQSTSTFRPTNTGNWRMMNDQWYGHWNDSSTNITSLTFDFGGGLFTGTIAVYAMR